MAYLGFTNGVSLFFDTIYTFFIYMLYLDICHTVRYSVHIPVFCILEVMFVINRLAPKLGDVFAIMLFF